MYSWYLKISRPRFWIYLLGPFLIGVIAASDSHFYWPTILLYGLYFTFPANLLIYGVNDIFDYETDKHNPKKQQYEELVTPAKRPKLITAIRLWNILAIVIVLAPSSLPWEARLSLTLFLFFGIFYSAPPIRAKIRPFLDTVFNTLYIFPGVFSYAVITGKFPPLPVVAAGTLWCMAMHAYSAVPDIMADKRAKISTVATVLGARGTLFFCLVCYLLSAVLSAAYIGAFSVLAGVVYGSMMIASLVRPDRENVFKLYKYFPYVNMAVGAALFFWVAALVK